ncbi:MAG: aminotransferase class IV, partial [Pseudomonadota bacterium]
MADFTRGVAFVYGDMVPISDAKIAVLDWGFLHSDATYDVVHVWEGRFFRLDDHLDRFLAGMERLRMAVPYDRDRIRSVLGECVALSGLRNAYVEMIATRGSPQPGSRDPRTCVNQFFAFAIPFVWIAEPGQGLHLAISDRQRIPPQSVDPTVKNYHWLDFVMGQFDAYDRGAETV